MAGVRQDEPQRWVSLPLDIFKLISHRLPSRPLMLIVSCVCTRWRRAVLASFTRLPQALTGRPCKDLRRALCLFPSLTETHVTREEAYSAESIRVPASLRILRMTMLSDKAADAWARCVTSAQLSGPLVELSVPVNERLLLPMMTLMQHYASVLRKLTLDIGCSVYGAEKMASQLGSLELPALKSYALRCQPKTSLTVLFPLIGHRFASQLTDLSLYTLAPPSTPSSYPHKVAFPKLRFLWLTLRAGRTWHTEEVIPADVHAVVSQLSTLHLEVLVQQTMRSPDSYSHVQSTINNGILPYVTSCSYPMEGPTQCTALQSLRTHHLLDVSSSLHRWLTVHPRWPLLKTLIVESCTLPELRHWTNICLPSLTSLSWNPTAIIDSASHLMQLEVLLPLLPSLRYVSVFMPPLRNDANLQRLKDLLHIAERHGVQYFELAYGAFREQYYCRKNKSCCVCCKPPAYLQQLKAWERDQRRWVQFRVLDTHSDSQLSALHPYESRCQQWYPT